MPAGETKTWTTRSLLDWMRSSFEGHAVDSPRLTAELLLESATGLGRMDLYTQADRPASHDELAQLRGVVRRVLSGEPVQYVLGEWPFFGLRFAVDRRVLIPRDCTELLCEEVIQHARSRPRGGGEPGEGLVIIDVGTGSGCVAIALAKNLPGATVVAGDVSADALDVAMANAEAHSVGERIAFVRGDGLGPLAASPTVAGAGGADYVVSNPPYIPDGEWNDPAMVDRVVREHEPELALRGGPDGLAVIGPLIRSAPAALKPGGLLAVETAASHFGRVCELIEQQPGLRLEGRRRDLDGHERVAVAIRD
jgi:release factor glutamine methyltransferase